MNASLDKSPSLPDLSIRIMLQVLADEGFETEGALAAAGLPLGLPALPGEVAPEQEIAFQSAFVALTGFRPDLWVETGTRYHLPNYGNLGLALLTSGSLADMVGVAMGMRELDYSLATIEPILVRGELAGQSISADQVPDALREFTTYRDLGAIMTALRDVWTSSFPVQQLQVALPRPTNREFTIDGHHVSFNADRTALLWDRSYSRRQLYHGNAALHAGYLAKCRSAGELRGARDDLVEVLCGRLRRSDGVSPTLSELAIDTGTSERTLQRRLQLRGVRFRDLLEEARRRVAIDLLSGSSMPVAEVAWRLGYSEPTSFSHAFRRWTGVTPGALRRKAALPAGSDWSAM